MASSGVGKTLLKLKANVAKGDYYEAFQMYHSISQRYIKQKKFQEAMDLLQDGAINMLEHDQHGSAIDLSERLVDIFQTQKTPLEKARAPLLEIFYKFPIRTSYCDQYVMLIMKFSHEDPSLHHAIGTWYFQAGDIYNAEYHLVRGSIDSAKTLALLEFEFSNKSEASSKNSDKGYYLCRGLLSLLVVGKVEEAIACFDAFKLLLNNDDFIDGDKSRLFKNHSLYNFAFLLLLIIQKNAGDKFGSLVTNFLEALEFDDVLLECINKIGAVYFKIGLREKQSNPFAEMFKQMMAGPVPANTPQIADVEAD